jgi:hypothetical protein
MNKIKIKKKKKNNARETFRFGCCVQRLEEEKQMEKPGVVDNS